MTDLQRDGADESAASAGATLRQQAERTFAARQTADAATRPAVDGAQLLHELQVHQIELEMQNEELRRAQEALAALQARYFDLYDLAPVGYITLSEQGIMLETNRAATVLLGTTRRVAGEQRLTQFILPEDQDIYYQHRWRLLQTDEAQCCELRMVRSNGEMRWVRLDMTVARGTADGSNITRIVLSDITAVQQAKLALQVSEAKWRNVIAQSSEGIVLVDQQGIAVIWNAAQERITGLPSACALGKPIWDAQFANSLPEDQTEEKRARVRASIRHALATQMAPWFYQTLEHAIVRPDGAMRAIESTTFPIHTEQGFMIGSLTRDITARKQAEGEHEQLLAQLVQAQKTEAIGRLAGGIAHDFNNMLAVILIRTEMILQTADPATPLHRNLTAIYTTAQRSAGLVRQLLGFARKQTIAPRLLDLNAAVAGTLPMLRQLIGEECALAWHPGAALWSIKIDPSQVDQILTNLCANARDAIDGVGTIAIETANVTIEYGSAATGLAFAPGDYVRLAVSDSGAGIDQEVLAHIFDPFFTTKDVGKGAGLGLATVDGIVQQNGGQIQVSSTPGVGTTFHIYLPRLAETVVMPAENRPQPLPPGHGETVLLVEDEPTVLNMASDALQHLGYTVLAAATPTEAIHLAADPAVAVDLLMTDIVMPEMNGHELAQRIAARRPDIKRIYVSGYPADFVAHRGVLEAGVHFLQKPFTLQDLAAKVQEVLT